MTRSATTHPGETITMYCRRCGGDLASPSRFHWFDLWVVLLFMRPYRCFYCQRRRYRFWRFGMRRRQGK